jgi:hypothetical protein
VAKMYWSLIESYVIFESFHLKSSPACLSARARNSQQSRWNDRTECQLQHKSFLITECFYTRRREIRFILQKKPGKINCFAICSTRA